MLFQLVNKGARCDDYGNTANYEIESRFKLQFELGSGIDRPELWMLKLGDLRQVPQ